MFGEAGTFRDTGARLNHIENKRGPESCTTEAVDTCQGLRQEIDYSKPGAARQLIKNDIFTNNTRSELKEHKLKNDFTMADNAYSNRSRAMGVSSRKTQL